jgi:septum formation protein
VTDARLYLASASPRRRELLSQIGVRFSVAPASIAEVPFPAESAEHFVMRMAREKAVAIQAAHPDALILGADTDVILDGEILGKPDDEAHASDMLQRLAGRAHQVLSGVALASPAGCTWRLSESRVHFRPLSHAEIHAYWQTGEPAGKAGGYAIQGLAAAFIQRLEGSYSGVMGLPLYETAQLLHTAGIHRP